MATLVTTIEAHSSYVNKVIFQRDGKSVISIGFNGEVKKWNIEDGSLIVEYKGHIKSVNDIALLNGGSEFITGCAEGYLRIWNQESSSFIKSFSTGKKSVLSLKVMQGKRYAVCSTEDQMLLLIDLDTGLHVANLKSYSKNVRALDINIEESFVLIGGLGGSLHLHSIPDTKNISIVEVHDVAVAAAKFIMNSGQIVSLGYHGDLGLRDLSTLEEVDGKILEGEGFYDLALSPDNKMAAVSCAFGIFIIDMETLRVAERIDVASKGNYGLSVSPDGNLLALASADKRVRIWQVR